MRLVMPIAFIAAVAVVGAALMVMTREGSTPAATETRSLVPPQSVAPIASAPAPALQAPTKSGARPVTPVYAPLPPETQAIYRCRTGTTTYSNHPCAGGKVVDPTSAVLGYVTTSSTGLTRLVQGGAQCFPGPSVARSHATRTTTLR